MLSFHPEQIVFKFEILDALSTFLSFLSQSRILNLEQVYGFLWISIMLDDHSAIAIVIGISFLIIRYHLLDWEELALYGCQIVVTSTSCGRDTMRYELISTADIDRIVTVRHITVVDDMLRCFANPTLILIFELSNEFLKILILNYRSICRLHHHILVDHFIITHNTIHISITIVG